VVRLPTVTVYMVSLNKSGHVWGSAGISVSFGGIVRTVFVSDAPPAVVYEQIVVDPETVSNGRCVVVPDIAPDAVALLIMEPWTEIHFGRTGAKNTGTRADWSSPRQFPLGIGFARRVRAYPARLVKIKGAYHPKFVRLATERCCSSGVSLDLCTFRNRS
jgi:hypothetical protein